MFQTANQVLFGGLISLISTRKTQLQLRLRASSEVWLEKTIGACSKAPDNCGSARLPLNSEDELVSPCATLLR